MSSDDEEIKQLEIQLGKEVRKLVHRKKVIGKLLLEAKPLVGHGNWTAWVEARGLEMRSAERYMKLAEGENDNVTDSRQQTPVKRAEVAIKRLTGAITRLQPADRAEWIAKVRTALDDLEKHCAMKKAG